MFRDVEIDILSSDILLHFIRAHKFIYAMTKIENLNFMINSSPFILDMIFDQAYSLIIKESMSDFVNYNILGEFLIELSKKQPNCVANSIMNDNLLFAFLENIEYPRACDALQIFLTPFHPEKELSTDVTINLWKYCRCMNFFDVMSVKLLNGVEVPKRLISFENKPYDKTIIKLTQPDLITNNTHLMGQNMTNINPDEAKQIEFIVEEKFMLKTDIDRIMGLIEDIKKGKNPVDLIEMKRVSKWFVKRTLLNNPVSLFFYEEEEDPLITQ